MAVDRKTNMVVVKGKTAEPMKLCDRIRHKTGRNAHLLSPLPKPQEEQPKEDENKVQKEQQQKEQVCISYLFSTCTHVFSFAFYNYYFFNRLVVMIIKSSLS